MIARKIPDTVYLKAIEGKKPFTFENSKMDSSGSSPLRDESDIDAQLSHEQERASMFETIESLKKELSVVKSQFEQSLAINKKVESVHLKNQKLHELLRSVQSERDDVLRRLEISLRSAEELKAKLNDEKLSSAQQHSNDVSEKEKEINRIKKECNENVSVLEEKLKVLTQQNEKQDVKAKMLVSKAERLLANAKEYFQKNFEDIDSLTDFLGQPQMQTAESNALERDMNLEMLKKKNKCDRKKMKQAKRACVRLSNEVESLRKKLDGAVMKNQLLSSSFETQIQQIKEDGLRNNENNEQKIKQMSDQIYRLKNENQRLKCLMNDFQDEKGYGNENQQYQLLQKQLEDMRKQMNKTSNFGDQISKKQENLSQIELIGLKEEAESLARANSELSKKLQNLEKKCNNLSSTVKELENTNTKIMLERENAKNELSALQLIHAESLKEISSLRDSLHGQCGTSEAMKTEKKTIKSLKEKLQDSEKKINDLTAQLNEMQVEREANRHIKCTLETKTKTQKLELEEAHQKISNLNDEITDLKQQLKSENESGSSIDEIIPPYAWRYNDFDPALTKQIEKIIFNPLLQPASKISHIYKIIHQFYTEKLHNRDETEKSLVSEISEMKNKFNKFLIDVSIILTSNAVTINDFMAKHGEERILNILSNLIKTHEELKRRESYFSTVIINLENTFPEFVVPVNNPNINYNFAQAVDYSLMISSIRAKIDNLSSRMKSKTKKQRQMKSLLNAMRNSVEKEINDLKDELENQTAISISLEGKCNALSETNKNLKHELETTKTSLNNLRQERSENDKSFQNDFEQILKDTRSKLASEEEALRIKVQQLMLENDCKTKQIETQNSIVEKLRISLKQCQTDLNERDSKIISLTNERDTLMGKAEEKCNLQKKQLVETYEKAVAAIKQQCDNHRIDLEKVSKQLIDSEQKNKQTKNSLIALKREKMKLEGELKIAVDQAYRERQICDADNKNKVMSLEASYEHRLQEYKNKWENEKRRIFSFTVDQFRQYFNPSEPMNERNFRSLLGKIKKELDKLTESDSIIRRLVGANPKQPTDEAVSQIVLS